MLLMLTVHLLHLLCKLLQRAGKILALILKVCLRRREVPVKRLDRLSAPGSFGTALV